LPLIGDGERQENNLVTQIGRELGRVIFECGAFNHLRTLDGRKDRIGLIAFVRHRARRQTLE
jgi:hypothetical protein